MLGTISCSIDLRRFRYSEQRRSILTKVSSCLCLLYLSLSFWLHLSLLICTKKCSCGMPWVGSRVGCCLRMGADFLQSYLQKKSIKCMLWMGRKRIMIISIKSLRRLVAQKISARSCEGLGCSTLEYPHTHTNTYTHAHTHTYTYTHTHTRAHTPFLSLSLSPSVCYPTIVKMRISIFLLIKNWSVKEQCEWIYNWAWFETCWEKWRG
jgi:hypothetical protein